MEINFAVGHRRLLTQNLEYRSLAAQYIYKRFVIQDSEYKNIIPPLGQDLRSFIMYGGFMVLLIPTGHFEAAADRLSHGLGRVW